MNTTLNFLVFAFAITILSGCNQLNKKVIEKYDDGKPRKLQYFDKKNQMVREEEYYPSGEMHYSGEYANGLRDGKWMFWFQNGNKWSEGNFKSGVRNGIARVYHDNGKLFYTGNYIDGKKDGKWSFYDREGKLSNEIQFNKGIFMNQANQTVDSLPNQ